MSTLTDDALVGELARDAVEAAAPQELPLFRAASRRFFDDPDGSVQEQQGKDELLGFGIETAAILITPVALCVARSVVRFVIAEVTRAAKDESSSAIQSRVRRLFRRGDGDEADEAEVEGLTDDQLVEVRRVALEKAAGFGLAPGQAEILADAMVGSLATAGA